MRENAAVNPRCASSVALFGNRDQPALSPVQGNGSFAIGHTIIWTRPRPSFSLSLFLIALSIITAIVVCRFLSLVKVFITGVQKL